MNRILRAIPLVLALCMVRPAIGQGDLLPIPKEQPVVGVNTPAVSPDGKSICFSYQGDLWTVASTGGAATRLTIHEAHDAWPRWSPDGRWIAFASNRDGAYNVYVVPATGGEPKRLTYHSMNTYPTDWSPDGTKILTYTMRGVDKFQIYSLDVRSGAMKALTDDDLLLRYGVYSPDGKTIAYNRGGGIGVWWRPRYHGSAHMGICLKSLTTGKVAPLSDYDGTELWPMFAPSGKTLYFASDRSSPGVPNIVACPVTGGRTSLVTRFTSDAVRWPSIALNGSVIAFVRAGELYTVSPKSGDPVKLRIVAQSDDKRNNLIRLSLVNSASEIEAAPDGKTLAMVVRGELWTLPATGGDAKRLTINNANDYDINWSPDGKKLVFSSDRGGNFNIFTIDVATRAEKQVSTGSSDENSPTWSPDGKRIAFLRSGADGGIYVAAVDGSGTPVRVAESQGNNLFGVGINSYSWSPDSKWIAFSRRDATNTNDIWVVSSGGGKPVNVTYYPGDNDSPQWTSDGKYLVFNSSRDRDNGEDIYSLSLQREKQEADEGKADGKKPQPPKVDAKGPEPKPVVDRKPAEGKPSVDVKIDFDDIENRAKRITTQGSDAFQLTPDGKSVVFMSAASGPPDFWKVGVTGGTVTRMTTTGDGTGVPRFGSDPSRFWCLGAGGTIKSVVQAGPGYAVSPVGFMCRMELDRRAEMLQAFNEFWRRLNVAFYDPHMHGVDWKAVRERYLPQLAGVGTREEFSMFLLSMMVGELNSSHSEVSSSGNPGPQVAELGLTFDDSYVGPGLKVTAYLPKGPDDDLGPKVKPGEYVLQIDGEDVSWCEEMWKQLYDKAGKDVELLVSAKPTKEGARTVKIKAIDGGKWRDLLYDEKVREARKKVEELSGGRLAYVHIRGMNPEAMKVMERELWGKASEKEGLVLDVRDNGGGNTHDSILAQLSRIAYGYTQPRDGQRSTQPFRHWDRPIVLLINEGSASDAEIFPNGFRALKLGKIVGVPTPGYVIGTYEGRLVDGTSYRIPMWGWYMRDGKNMENNGCRPDVLVEQTPDDIAAKRDRQLEVAVQQLLKELPKK